jgi:hypothetical protein
MPMVLQVYRHLNYPKFIAGSVFWINLGPLLTFFREHDVQAEIDSLWNETGFVTDVMKNTDGSLIKSPKYTHCWERLWILVFRRQNVLFKTVCGGGVNLIWRWTSADRLTFFERI